MPGLADKYRPTTWNEVVAQEKTVARLKELAARGGLAGRAYFLTGQSGTGKSTIARLIAQEVADPFLIEEVDAAALTVAQLQSLEAEMQLSGRGRRAGALTSSTKRTRCESLSSVSYSFSWNESRRMW